MSSVVNSHEAGLTCSFGVETLSVHFVLIQGAPLLRVVVDQRLSFVAITRGVGQVKPFGASLTFASPYEVFSQCDFVKRTQKTEAGVSPLMAVKPTENLQPSEGSSSCK